MIYGYLALFFALVLLMIVSRKEKVVSRKKLSFFIKPVRKAAVKLCRMMYRILRRTHRIFPGSKKVKSDFFLLDSQNVMAQNTALYYIEKVQNFLLFVIAADLLAIAVWGASHHSVLISKNEFIDRPSYGEDDLEVTLEAANAEDAVSYGEYQISIGARQYTEEETQKMAEEVFKQLPILILGTNESLSLVTDDLNLVSSVEGYPFTISWESSGYEWIQSDGAVNTEDLEEGESEEIVLTAILSYEDRTYEESVNINIYSALLSQEERIEQEIQEALEENNKETLTGERYYLPSNIENFSLVWEEVKEDSSAKLFLFIILAGIAVFVLQDRDLHQKVLNREQQMAIDYPQIVSRLVLYLGAGMSVRNAFQRMGEGYQEERRKGGESHAVYEEILLACRELNSGISEYQVYIRLGNRCHMKQYTKLCSLLSQNLKKGNRALLDALQEEADLALEERKNLARQMGEEAGTKLLLPMIMMLGITLVIIMIPAYLSFSF